MFFEQLNHWHWWILAVLLMVLEAPTFETIKTASLWAPMRRQIISLTASA